VNVAGVVVRSDAVAVQDRLEWFRQQFGGESDVLVRAPGRVNLIGDHTDYCDGFVLPLAVDRECLVAARRSGDGRVVARSADGPGLERFVAGVIEALAAAGVASGGVEIEVASSVPLGSGLSSSAALAVGLTVALAKVAGATLDPLAVARVAHGGEARATGVETGLMDQLASVFGVEDHALLIDCRTFAVEPIRLPSALAVLVVNSGLPRTVAGSAYADRRDACAAAARRLGLRALRDAALDQVRDDPLARHVVTENHRVHATAEALRTGDVGALGPLLLQSHASLRDDYRVSTPELDLLVDLLVEAGALGARLTGAGFGGCVVALVQRNHADDVAAKASLAYQRVTRIVPTAFAVRAVAGASAFTSARAAPPSSTRTPRG
jgi:galactokinase